MWNAAHEILNCRDDPDSGNLEEHGVCGLQHLLWFSLCVKVMCQGDDWRTSVSPPNDCYLFSVQLSTKLTRRLPFVCDNICVGCSAEHIFVLWKAAGRGLRFAYSLHMDFDKRPSRTLMGYMRGIFILHYELEHIRLLCVSGDNTHTVPCPAETIL